MFPSYTGTDKRDRISVICEKHFHAKLGIFEIRMLTCAQRFIKQVDKHSRISGKQAEH